jgi:ABC-type nitrate/sulfonate/bicarbonate transport system substrate-binding protein
LPVALQDGQVDAIVIWEPYALRALKLLADKARLLDTKDIYRQDFYFVAKKAFLDGKPEAAVRFLEAVYQAQKFIVENPQEAKRIIGKRMGLDSFELETQWNQFHFHLSLDQAMVLTLEDEARWAIGKGLVKSGTIPVYTDFFYTKALKQVDKNSALIFE